MYKCQILSIVVTTCLTLSTSLAFAANGNNPVNPQLNSENSNQSQLNFSNKKVEGYNKYLEWMRKLNDDRQCSNLPPQHVYSFKEYKEVY